MITIREENIPWESKRDSKCPYWYITKHGIGPGTLPKDVKVGKVKDLPNYYTVIWIDRPLSTDELKYYDIYPETMNNKLLDRLGISFEELEECNESLKEYYDDYNDDFDDLGYEAYEAKAYYNSRYSGLAYSEKFANGERSELGDWIWDMCQRGFYVTVYDYEDGEYSYYRLPENAEYIDLISVDDLETDERGNFLNIDDIGPK